MVGMGKFCPHLNVPRKSDSSAGSCLELVDSSLYPHIIFI